MQEKAPLHRNYPGDPEGAAQYCDICGKEIKLLGNRKLDDGNMCKDCAAKLSPWFSDRRHSTKAEIQEQLAYREQNQTAVADFHTTRSLGKSTKLLLDEDARKFMVTDAKDLAQANPDVLDYSQVTGCDLDIDERRTEKKRTDKDGKSVSYVPPRYEYSYEFTAVIRVNHPYFDEMSIQISNGYVHTGETAMGTAANSGWTVNRKQGILTSQGVAEYNECVKTGNEIKRVVDGMRNEIRREVRAAAAPKAAVTCPWCGATTVPDASGCCEYCGGTVNG